MKHYVCPVCDHTFDSKEDVNICPVCGSLLEIPEETPIEEPKDIKVISDKENPVPKEEVKPSPKKESTPRVRPTPTTPRRVTPPPIYTPPKKVYHRSGTRGFHIVNFITALVALAFCFMVFYTFGGIRVFRYIFENLANLGEVFGGENLLIVIPFILAFLFVLGELVNVIFKLIHLIRDPDPIPSPSASRREERRIRARFRNNSFFSMIVVVLIIELPMIVTGGGLMPSDTISLVLVGVLFFVYIVMTILKNSFYNKL